MDHLQAIRIFGRVVETGNFSRAASSLQLPSSTVSKWVAMLETHLGVKLLERSTRQVSVTSDGAHYYERSRHLLAELDALESTLGGGQSQPSGVLRVDCGGATASALLIPALPAFCARYPGIELRLSVTDRNVDLLAENIDCAIRSSADQPGVVSRRIGAARWSTCASPAYLARHGVPATPAQIVERRMPVVRYFSSTSGHFHPLQFAKAGAAVVLDQLSASVAVNESNAQLAAGLAGLGLIQTADFIVRPHLASGALVAVLAEYARAPLDIHLAYLPSRRGNARVRLFADWVAQLLEN